MTVAPQSTTTAIKKRGAAVMSRQFWRSEERRVGKECRSRCDWSSDVCSSDLCAPTVQNRIGHDGRPAEYDHGDKKTRRCGHVPPVLEIGRASCRERV